MILRTSWSLGEAATADSLLAIEPRCTMLEVNMPTYYDFVSLVVLQAQHIIAHALGLVPTSRTTGDLPDIIQVPDGRNHHCGGIRLLQNFTTDEESEARDADGIPWSDPSLCISTLCPTSNQSRAEVRLCCDCFSQQQGC